MPGEIDVEVAENIIPAQEVSKEVTENNVPAPEVSKEVAENNVPAPEVSKEIPEEGQNIQNNVAAQEAPKEVVQEEQNNVEAPNEEPQEVQNNQVEEVPVIEPKAPLKIAFAPTVSEPEPIVQQNGAPKKVTMATSLDAEAVRAAYDDVRSDSSETEWAVFKFDGQRIVCSGTGADFKTFREQFQENERAFGYIRIQTGDEMSKRQKFLFITWVGTGVSVLKRAKMSTDKSVIKNIISNFAVELQFENPSEIDLDHFKEQLNKAGGAHYGTGIREI